ncbi:unnamed protein product [Pedinophyceae sp. YPF-701]|nr:unnamed protein product [Pedinophyceae sp. YPF-701]
MGLMPRAKPRVHHHDEDKQDPEMAHRLRPDLADDESETSSVDDVQGRGQGVREMVKATLGAREFVLYVLFVVLFSIVTFNSKPGTEQYYLNVIHRDSFRPEGVDSVQQTYAFLRGDLADRMYPQTDSNGNILGPLARLQVSARSRQVGAMRIRQVRTNLTLCEDLPSRLKTLNTGNDAEVQQTRCMEPYSGGNQLREPIWANGTAELIELQDFTLPFNWQDTDQLNTSNIATFFGDHGSYRQSGYALDVVPNIAPNFLAQEFRACRNFIQRSIDQCAADQGVDQVAPATSPPATQPPATEPPRSNPNGPALLAAEGNVVSDPQNQYRFSIVSSTTFGQADQTRILKYTLLNNGSTVSQFEITIRDASGNVVQAPNWLRVQQAGQRIVVNPKTTLPVDIQVNKDDVEYAQVNNGATQRASGAPVFIHFTDTLQPPPANPSGRAIIELSLFYSKPPARRQARSKLAHGVAGALGPENRRAPRSAAGRRLSQSSNGTCEEIVPLRMYPGLDLSKCKRLPNIPDQCELRYVSLQQAVKYIDGDVCGRCACASPTDGRCLQTCSAKALFLEQLSILQQYAWLSDNTRAVVIDIPLLSQETALFTTVRSVIEFPYFGGVFPTVETLTYRLFRYVTQGDLIVLVLEFIFLAMTLYYTVQEVIEIARSKLAYLREAWNYIDWANLIIIYTVFGLRLASYLEIRSSDISSFSVVYTDYPSLGVFATQELNVAAFNFFLLYFKFFKYLSHVPRMDAILATIAASAFDLCLFALMGAVVMFGFAAAFYSSFGQEVKAHFTVADSMGTLCRILLGDFDYESLSDANAIMAPLLFYSFILVVFFILLNMFLAIVNDAYAEVKGNQSEEDLNFYINLKDKIASRLRRLMGKKDAINQLARDLMDEGRLADGYLDMDELREALKDNPRALEVLETTSVAELMKKYDVNRDGKLSRDELVEILKELAAREATLTNRIEDVRGQADAGAHAGAMNMARMAAMAGGGIGAAEIQAMESKLDKMEGDIKDMSRQVAKKMALLIELCMGLSDQVQAAVSGIQRPTSS